MKSQEINNTKKIRIILIVTLIGMGIGILITKIVNKPFLFNANDRFMDYFNTLRVSGEVYAGIGTGRGYFPFTYVLLNIIKFIISNPLTSYFVTVGLASVVIILFCNTFFENWDFLGMILIVFSSYPILFEFDRGNIEHLVLVFLLFFFICYKNKRYKLAAILIAFPICMKLYPALFAFLFLKDKKYKEFFLCGIFSIVLMIGSFVSIGGNLTNLPIAIENLNYFTETYAKTGLGVQYSHTIWSGLNCISIDLKDTMLTPSNMTFYTISIAVIALGLIGYIVFMEKEDWKAITILTIMMITFPHVSFDYTLIHMLIPITFFIISENYKKWESIIYSILFALTIIPMNWCQIYKGGITINLGIVARPLILMIIVIMIVITTLHKVRTNKKESVINE